MPPVKCAPSNSCLPPPMGAVGVTLRDREVPLGMLLNCMTNVNIFQELSLDKQNMSTDVHQIIGLDICAVCFTVENIEIAKCVVT